jgi:hypothetical protein
MSQDSTPKVFKKGYGSNFVIPFAIVLIGSLIIFGVTKMLQTDRGYRDLVRELHSKTFGNRWIAAFELSKVISANGVPKEEVPWLVDNMDSLYSTAADNRTKNFIIVTLGAIKSPLGLKTIELGLDESDSQTKFHSVVALSQVNIPSDYDWSKLISLLDSSDEGIQQAAILTLSTHRVSLSLSKILSLLESRSRNIRFASATGLIYFKETKALSILEKILKLEVQSGNKPNALDENKVYGLKLNIINGLNKTRWEELAIIVAKYIENEKNLKLVSAARQVLEGLKH